MEKRRIAGFFAGEPGNMAASRLRIRVSEESPAASHGPAPQEPGRPPGAHDSEPRLPRPRFHRPMHPQSPHPPTRRPAPVSDGPSDGPSRSVASPACSRSAYAASSRSASRVRPVARPHHGPTSLNPHREWLNRRSCHRLIRHNRHWAFMEGTARPGRRIAVGHGRLVEVCSGPSPGRGRPAARPARATAPVGPDRAGRGNRAASPFRTSSPFRTLLPEGSLLPQPSHSGPESRRITYA